MGSHLKIFCQKCSKEMKVQPSTTKPTSCELYECECGNTKKVEFERVSAGGKL